MIKNIYTTYWVDLKRIIKNGFQYWTDCLYFRQETFLYFYILPFVWNYY